MEMQVPVRQRFPPRHRGENAVDRAHERPGSYEHDDNRVHADVLQVRIQ